MRLNRGISERIRGFRYFGLIGWRKGIRVAGRVNIRGRKSNFNFGKNCKILGDLQLVIEDTWKVQPSISLGDNVTIEHGVYFNSHWGVISVGSNCHFGVGTVVQGGGALTIGNHVLFGPGTKIFASNHSVDNLDINISESRETMLGVTIGNNIWVGAGCIVLDGAILADKSVYGAGGIVIGQHAERTINVAKKVRVERLLGGKPQINTEG